MKKIYCSCILIIGAMLLQCMLYGQTVNFTGAELVGTPTNHSVVINIIPASTIEFYFEYGTTSGSYLWQTATATASSGVPYEMIIDNLNPDTRYYYRMQYRIPGGSWVIRDEHSFMTQRFKGSSFVFTVTSDIHATYNSSYEQAMRNIISDNPDFHIDLGDNFYPNGAKDQSAVNSAYLEGRKTNYLGAIGTSIPIFLASGNHEEEEGWNLDDTPFSIGVGSIQARKAFYPTPVSDGFYSGNNDRLAAIDEATYGNELREDYYAWEWGDALFVVIDEFQYTMKLPYTPAAGEGNDDPVNGDQWSWTLGEQQYDWLKETLETSTAKYKFVFSHNMLGGITRNIVGVGAGYVRGGAEAAAYFEWGGKNADGTEGFTDHRDVSFFAKPIHQLFVENGVSAYFHGHDHQYVYEKRDGIVYQEVPSPSMSGSGFSGIYTEGTYADYQTIKMLQNAGHLRISIGSSAATVDYINSGTGAVTYSYQIEPNMPGEDHILTMGVDPAAGGSTTPASGTHTYPDNTEVTITAIPAEGYVFDHWASDVADAHNVTTTVTLNSDKTVTAVFTKVSSAAVALDGAVSSNGVSSGTVLSIAHTTGTGQNRMTLVGISWNSGSANTNIDSVRFTPIGGTPIHLTEVITQLYNWSTSYRRTAIYSLPNPESAISGTIDINFPASVSNGIIAGAANFAGVDQTTPLGTPVGAVGTGSTSSGTPNPAVTLTGLAGNELIFDCVFIGASNTSHAMTANSDQTEIWNILGYTGSGSFNARGSASIMEATGTSATMSWTTGGYGTTATRWAIAAVPINPAASITTYTLTATSGINGNISPAGSITVGEGNSRTFAITPDNNYEIEDVQVDGSSVGAVSSYTFSDIHSDHTISASFKALPEYTIVATAGENGAITPSGSVPVIKGNDQTFTFAPLAGYRVSDVLVDGTSIGITAGYTFIDVAAGHSIHVSFEEIPAGSITYLGEIGTAIGDAAGTLLEIPVGSTGVAVGTTVIVGFCSRGASTYNEPEVTDDAGNTYALDTFAITYQHGRSYIFHAYINNALSSGQHIRITTTSVSSRVAVAAAFSGIAELDALDMANGNPTGTNNTNQGDNPSVTLNKPTTQENELIIGVFGTEDASSSADAGIGTWGNDFIAGPTAKSTSSASYLWRVSLGYRIVSSTGQFTASKTVANNPYWAASLAAYKTVSTLPSSSYSILLGRPTNNSITLNAILKETGEVYFEYGTTSGIYGSGQTSILAAVANEPVETRISGLSANTRYYYRLQFRPSGSSTWIAGSEYSFHTQRADNETFTFTLISDSHLGQTFSGNTPARYNQTTLNVAADHPDFHLDLGDAFIMEEASNQTEANAVYLAQRPYFGNFSHSTPVFLAIGNHENEEGWNLDDTPFSTGQGSIVARKEYFLNPVPDAFYTGDDSLLLGVGGDQLREDYYAWEWGDALFVVLDPFQYTMNLPYSNVTGSGETNDETVSGDQWNWTLGKKQYNWLKQTLENSTARYKFVFSHHVTGGQLTISNSSAGPATYVRGGAMAANYFEWGGLNADGSEGFENKRNGWNGDPVHQLLVENGVTAYFHGHDHQFVHEEIDGVVYQLVPTPGMEGYGFDLYDSSPYAQDGGNLPDPGHIRVTVSPEEALLEYVRSETGGGGVNGQIAYSYTMEPLTPQSSITVTSPNGSENWRAGSDHAVTWTSTGVSGNIHIEYSTNNGTSWTDIVSSTENDGSYVWTIPNIPSTSCLVKVSELDGNPVDMSNAVFVIYNLPENHFIPVSPVNNGYDHMNFYALTAKISGEDLQPGDEIGIFDNSVCIGAGEITQILDGQDIYLPIKISRDDPEVSGIDGYTAGNLAIFRLWDESEEKEITTFSITYKSGDGVFTPGASSWFYINGETSLEQQIELQSGWNIFSLYVTPENINLMAIVQPLIDAGRLIKVQDELGDAIEKNPVTHKWFNDIGDWGVTEGYKINVSVDTVLNVNGSPVGEAVDIDLLAGWNIISYPVSISEDGITVVNPLITAGSLIKVQDEDGDAIEENPVQHTWFNDIGLFNADEGYKVNVNSPTRIIIDPGVYGTGGLMLKKEVVPVYSTKSTLKSTAARHFKPIWSGNGVDHMNIYISETADGNSGLMTGDEIGIFDGEICVGSGVIAKSGAGYYSFVASADDPITNVTDGFMKGNTIGLKAWRSANNKEIDLEDLEFIPGSSRVFESMNTAWIRVNSIALDSDTKDQEATCLVNNYPNPFSSKTTIQFTLAKETKVNMEVYDVLGNKISTLVNSNFSQGSHSIIWEVENDKGGMVKSGVYYLKMTAGNEVFVKTIILVRD